jgi:hypothetical protein
MDVSEIEALLPNSFLKLHEAIKKIFKDNNLLPNEEFKDDLNLSLILKTVLKLYSSLMKKNGPSNQEEIESMIRSMDPAIFGADLYNEVCTLLRKLDGMTDIIYASMNEIKDYTKERDL